MFEDPAGPIEHYSWARFVICGKEHSALNDTQRGAGKDIRLIGKSVTAWMERKGHHLTHSMITGIYDLGIDVLIIGTGAQGLIECPDAVKKSIRENGISQLLIKPTPEACRAYNTLFHKNAKVALLAHGTC
jgi:hypothetical protein